MAKVDKQMLEPLLTGFISVAKNMAYYNPGHPSVKEPLLKLYRELAELLRVQGKLTLGIVDEVLVFEGIPFYTSNLAIKDLQGRLESWEINALEIIDGLTEKEFSAFIELLNRAADKGEENN